MPSRGVRVPGRPEGLEAEDPLPLDRLRQPPQPLHEVRTGVETHDHLAPPVGEHQIGEQDRGEEDPVISREPQRDGVEQKPDPDRVVGEAPDEQTHRHDEDLGHDRGPAHHPGEPHRGQCCGRFRVHRRLEPVVHPVLEVLAGVPVGLEDLVDSRPEVAERDLELQQPRPRALRLQPAQQEHQRAVEGGIPVVGARRKRRQEHHESQRDAGRPHAPVHEDRHRRHDEHALQPALEELRWDQVEQRPDRDEGLGQLRDVALPQHAEDQHLDHQEHVRRELGSRHLQRVPGCPRRAVDRGAHGCGHAHACSGPPFVR